MPTTPTTPVPRTIFLIEDNPTLRENTKILLTLNGYEVFDFDSGPPALAKLGEKIPDLVLCDIILPGMSGYEVLARVRETPTASQIPFVFLSALAEREQVREGMDLGADDYLTKPFTSQGLLAAIKTRLQRAEERRDEGDRQLQSLRAMKLKSLPHEIRTPLNGILGGLQILRADAVLLGNQGREILDLIEESTLRLEKTTLNYILFLALSAGRNPFESTTPADAGLLVTGIATKLARAARRENDLILRTVEGRTHCGGCLDRVVSEVVSNAFKFSEPGSKVEVKIEQSQGRLHFSCRDYGCGMTEQEIGEIGPFKQFHRDAREQQGLGLGLAICKAQLKCEGCHLTLKSMHPYGLLAEIFLPDGAGSAFCKEDGQQLPVPGATSV